MAIAVEHAILSINGEKITKRALPLPMVTLLTKTIPTGALFK